MEPLFHYNLLKTLPYLHRHTSFILELYLMDWKKYVWFLKNKYILVLLLLFVYLFFLEDVNIFNLYERKAKRQQLIEEKSRKLKNIKTVREQLEDLKDDDKLEKFARENYYFKKDNEDVFVIHRE